LGGFHRDDESVLAALVVGDGVWPKALLATMAANATSAFDVKSL
jgi:hypothetical protein